MGRGLVLVVFLFNDTATTEIYTYGHTLSLHDALPICLDQERRPVVRPDQDEVAPAQIGGGAIHGAQAGLAVERTLGSDGHFGRGGGRIVRHRVAAGSGGGTGPP